MLLDGTAAVLNPDGLAEVVPVADGDGGADSMDIGDAVTPSGKK